MRRLKLIFLATVLMLSGCAPFARFSLALLSAPSKDLSDGGITGVKFRCPSCNGSGFAGIVNCGTCKGTGRR